MKRRKLKRRKPSLVVHDISRYVLVFLQVSRDLRRLGNSKYKEAFKYFEDENNNRRSNNSCLRI